MKNYRNSKFIASGLVCLTILFLLLSKPTSISAAAGDVDRSFGAGGVLRTNFPAVGYEVGGSIFQPDGKYIVVGALNRSGTGRDFYILRFNADGTLDNTFGTGGSTTVSVSTRDDYASGVTIQPDGKIIVVGITMLEFNYTDFAVVRLNQNGTPDETFGNAGLTTTSTSGSYEYATDVIVQSDYKIVVAGRGVASGMTMTVVRYSPNGTLDDTFDGDGIARIQFSTGLSSSSVVRIQPDGKILIAGAAAIGDFTYTVFGLARLNSDGTPDNTFGDGGKVSIDVAINAAQQSVANDVLFQPDGKIVAVGYTNSGLERGYDFALVRLNPDGTPDVSFGNSGKVVTHIPESKDDFAVTVELQTDGKLLVAGSSSISSEFRNALIRYRSDGTLDTQFGNNGIVWRQTPAGSTGIRKMRFDAHGRVFTAGHSRFEATFVSYQTIGSRDFDFDGDKKTDVGIFRPSDGSWWYTRSSSNDFRVFTFGASSDIIAPGDYTGDGKADIGVFRPSTGEWFIQRSEDNSFFAFPFGTTGDVPVPSDYDGDGKTDAAVFRPSSGTWFILNSGGGGIGIVNFGNSEDKPVPADFDGDSKADIAIFRPSDGSWWYLRSTDLQFRVFRFGVGTDKPVQGDYTGDGRADIAIFRPSTGEWFFQRSEDNSFYSVPFGAAGDMPAPGDYDGDGRFDTAVFRPSTANWFVQRSTAGILITNFGANGDKPIPNAFVP